MKDKYEALEGKEVECIVKGLKNFTAIVTGCDKDIGLTIQRKSNNDYVGCVTGPSSHLWLPEFDKALYEATFSDIVEMIEAGVYNETEILDKHYGGCNVQPATEEVCSFV